LRPVATLVVATVVLVFSAAYGVLRAGADPSIVNNIAWVVAHVVILQGFIRYTFVPTQPLDPAEKPAAPEGLSLLGESQAATAGGIDPLGISTPSPSTVQDWGDV
jgi:hypothetical protein